jgi:hypothetical protein
MHTSFSLFALLAAAHAAAFTAPAVAPAQRAALQSPSPCTSTRSLRLSLRAQGRGAGASALQAQIDQLRTAGPVSRPEVGKVPCASTLQQRPDDNLTGWRTGAR